MVVVAVETFEVLAVVGQEYDLVFVTPLEQFGIAGLFPEPVFRLFDIVTSLGQHSFEHPSNVFVQQERRRHSGYWTGSFGFSDDSRTRLKARSLARSSSRISSTCS